MDVSPIDSLVLDQVASIHCAAFPQSCLTKLGCKVVQRYYEWQFQGPHELVALGAIENGRVVGYCFSGVFRGAFGGFVRANRAFLIQRLMVRPDLILETIRRGRSNIALKSICPRSRRSLPKSGIAGDNRPPFSVLAIAVHPGHRRRGIGQALLENVEDRARHAGFGSLDLTVNKSNKEAVSFYERSGWEVLGPLDSDPNALLLRRILASR